jgi:flagellar FliJ protein
MAKPFRLQTVLDLAGRKLESAGAQLQELRASWQRAQEQLDDARSHRAQYEAHLASALSQGLEADRLRDFQAFLGRLGQAIDAQSAQVQRCRQAWEEARSRWLQLRSREQALQILRERHKQREARGEAGIEQKQQDEFALRGLRGRPLDSSAV